MGDERPRSVPRRAGRRRLDEQLGVRVEPARRLVEDHEAGVGEEDAPERRAAALRRRTDRCRPGRARCRDRPAEPPSQPPRPSSASSASDALVGRRMRAEQRDVVAQRAAEQLHLLRDHGDPLAEVADADRSQVDAADDHGAARSGSYSRSSSRVMVLLPLPVRPTSPSERPAASRQVDVVQHRLRRRTRTTRHRARTAAAPAGSGSASSCRQPCQRAAAARTAPRRGPRRPARLAVA